MTVRIVIDIPDDFVPIDGDAFDAVRDALAHFDIPGTLQVVTEPQP